MIRPTAGVSPQAGIDAGTCVWREAQVREGVDVGRNSILHKGVYVDFNARIGDNVKVQNYALIWHDVTIEDGVFISPYTCLSNDRRPHAVAPDCGMRLARDEV